jgi:hypothetical protein
MFGARRSPRNSRGSSPIGEPLERLVTITETIHTATAWFAIAIIKVGNQPRIGTDEQGRRGLPESDGRNREDPSQLDAVDT